MDGLVLATILAKFCPWVSAKFGEMHLNPFMPELCLHNALIITDVIRELQENAQTKTVSAKPEYQKSRGITEIRQAQFTTLSKSVVGRRYPNT